MTELEKHIEILLLNNDCVIVPGFGGFMAHHVDAVYVEEEGCFIPPSRTLGFNPQLHINDSLLAQSYVETYDISYPEALRHIEDDVRELKQTIEKEGYYELNDIGVININVDGNYIFEPYLSGVLTPELYALSSFEMSVLAGKQAHVNETVCNENPKANGFILDNECETALTDASLNEDNVAGEDEQTSHLVSINVTSLRNIAAAAILLVMFVFASMPIGDSSKKGNYHCAIDTSILTRFMPQVQNIQNEDITPVKVINNVVVSTKHTNEEILINDKINCLAEEKIEFVIVLASKISRKSAESFIEILKKDGIMDARLDETTSAKKVICGNYSSEKEANNAAQKLRNKSSNYNDVWVMKHKK